MVESTKNSKNLQCKHFPIDAQNSFAQFELSMSEEAYNQLTQVDKDKKVNNQGRVLIQCLDRSGSMSGSPYEAVRAGTTKLCEAILTGEDRPFERFITNFWCTSLDEFESTDLDEYKAKIKNSGIVGGTDFRMVFNHLRKFIVENSDNLTDLTIIFFTDGQDGCSGRQALEETLNDMKALCLENKHRFTVRFLAIGFSSSHDAAFMNSIAQTGSELGNFLYIDTSQGNYQDKVVESLQESLEMALEGSAGTKLNLIDSLEKETNLNFEANFQFGEDEQQDTIVGVTLYAQTIIDQNMIESLQSNLVINKEKTPLNLEISRVFEPNPQVLLKARIQNINKQLFELIQSVQQANKRDESMTALKDLDLLLNQYHEEAMKIKDRQLRQESMQQITDCKAKVVEVLAILRSAGNYNMSNALIAQLNDVAYKAIRKRGVQKKLDERAMKNEATFKANDNKLKKMANKIDEDKLRAEHKDLIEQLGCCPMSQCDIIELLKEGDCMGLCLDIARSEAVISDPSKLIIKGIVPTFMSIDSFMESSIFKLSSNQDASGGFNYKNQGELALGVGRESVSGLLPLGLFKEHTQMSLLKRGPLLGFMCCLDPMGYAPSQAFNVPFLVLLKAMEDVAQEPSEMKKMILGLVLDTCKDMVCSNETFKKQIIDQVNKFIEKPENRTADVVASIQVLSAQLYTYLQLSEEEQLVQNIEPQETVEQFILSQDLQTYGRFACEELQRRMLKRDADTPTRANIIKMLFPKCQDTYDKYKSDFNAQLMLSLKGPNGDDDGYGMYQGLAQEMMVAAGEAGVEQADPMEESKETTQNTQKEKVKEVRKEDVVKEIVKEQTWLLALANEGSQASTMIQGGKKALGSQGQFFECMRSILKSDTPINYKDLFGVDEELVFAIIFQNVMHPKNAKRREAITSGEYVELKGIEDAKAYLSHLLENNLTTQLMGIESECRSVLERLQQGQGVQLVIEAKSVYLAAAVMNQKEFKNGCGDRKAIIDFILSADPSTIPDLVRKLRLLTCNSYYGNRIYSDGFKDEVQEFTIRKNIVFRLWQHLCKRHNAVTAKELAELLPLHEERIMLWDEFANEHGIINKEVPEFVAYRKKRDQKKKEKDLKMKAAQQNKTRI